MIGSGTPISHNNAPLVKSMIRPPPWRRPNAVRPEGFQSSASRFSSPTTGNVLHLIHFRSERTNRNRANQRGAIPNNLFSRSTVPDAFASHAAGGCTIIDLLLLMPRLTPNPAQDRKRP
jgi:hypothetical protein